MARECLVRSVSVVGVLGAGVNTASALVIWFQSLSVMKLVTLTGGSAIVKDWVTSGAAL